MGRELKYVLVRDVELKIDNVYLPGAKELLGELKGAGIAVISPEEGLEKLREECLLLAATDALLELGNQKEMAVLAFENAAYPDEKRTASPVLLQGFEEIDVTCLKRIWQRKQGIPWEILETKRCVVRELALDDLDDLFELYAQSGMTDYMEPLYERAEEEEYQRAYIENMYGFYGYGMWLVFEKESGRLLGRAGLEHRELSGEWELEMGYAIAPEFWHKGYATEVCQAIMAYAWDNLDYERINCLIEPENHASIGLVKKLGFDYVGKIKQEGHIYARYVICR